MPDETVKPSVSPVEVLLQLNVQFGTEPAAEAAFDAGPEGAQELAFPGGEALANAAQSIVTALTSAFTTISNSLAALARDLATLDVETYVVPGLETFSTPAGTPGGASATGSVDGFANLLTTGRRVAWTRVKLDGDIQAAVPLDGGRLNEALWQTHKDMVSLAQANRAMMIKTAVDALTGLIMPPKAG